MDFIKYKSKEIDDTINNYNLFLKNKIDSNLIYLKKKKKILENDFKIPEFNEYNYLCIYNFNTTQLKAIATYYKIKKNGNKEELQNRIVSYLYLSHYLITIQKSYRGYLQRKINNLRGPALLNRTICTNDRDFCSCDDLSSIPFNQFFSYKDLDQFVYGFDISSLYNLYKKSNDKTKIENPYNRNKFPDDFFQNLTYIIKKSKSLFKININVSFEIENNNLSLEKSVEFRSITLFQEIDLLGNYSDSKWLFNLSKNNLIKFLRELADIWNYRAQLTNEMKRQIVPGNIDPFRDVNLHFLYSIQDKNVILNIVLTILEKLVFNGINRDAKYLGASYILAALTLVNEETADALPWLYQSVHHIN
jgi:hypothetical protein